MRCILSLFLFATVGNAQQCSVTVYATQVVEYQTCQIAANPTLAATTFATCTVTTKTSLDMTKMHLGVDPLKYPGDPFTWDVHYVDANHATVRVRNVTWTNGNLLATSFKVAIMTGAGQ